MIKKLHGASSTLVANPRRKKRNPKRKHARKNPSRRRRVHASGMMANPKRRKRHNPLHKRGKAKRHNPLRRKRRNPGGKMLEIAGVDVGSMAIGSVGAIAVSSALQGFISSMDFYKNASGAAKDYHLYDAIAPAAVAAGAAFAYKKSSGQVKEIAKYAFIGSVFLAIQKVVGGKIEDATKDLFTGAKTTAAAAAASNVSSTKAGTAKDANDASKGVYKSGETGPDGKTIAGLYLDTVTGKRAVGGMYMPTGMSGMYMPTSGSAGGSVQADMGGLGLFKSKSIYGA
jgi:hypothetical protein